MMDNNVAILLYSIYGLISKIYPQIDSLLQKLYERLCKKSITFQKISAFEINSIVLNKVPGTVTEYKSIDCIINNKDAVLYPSEF